VFGGSLKYLIVIKRLPLPTKRVTAILIKVKSCNALLRILRVCISHHHHHHHLALQPFVGFLLLSQVSPSSSILSSLLPVFNFQLFRSSMTSSYHRCLGLPTGLLPTGLQPNSFPVGLTRSIRWICPSPLILCTLMNLTISAPSINLSISVLFRILHIFSILTGPNMLLSIFLAGMYW